MSQSELRLTTELLAAYLEGEVPASDHAAIEAALRDDPRAQRRLDQLRHIASSLSAPATELAQVDLVARVRAELKKPPAPKHTARTWAAWGAGLAVAAGAALMVRQAVDTGDEGFRAKSANSAASTAEHWAGIQIHRLATPTSLEPLDAQMQRGDDLVFSYTNLGPEPFPYLMIFGVDGAREVRWFYPQYEQAGTDPKSVAIKARAEVSLGDVIGHDYAEGPLAIHALFTRHPLSVSEVEGWLQKQPNGLERLPIDDASLQVVRIRVLR